MRVSALLVFLVAAPAAAFPTGDLFDADGTATAGGDGIYFTGSPAFPGATCAACHLAAPHTAGVQVGVDDPSLFSAGYAPGQTYQLEVRLMNESRGLQYNGPARCNPNGKTFIPCNSNGFALEADDAGGHPAGILCPVPPVAGACPSPTGGATLLGASNTAILSSGELDGKGFESNDATRWSFYWVAPAPTSGPITFHVGLVDGNGGLGTKLVPRDVDGDDVVMAHLAAPERDMATRTVSSGCRAAGDRPGKIGGWPLALVLGWISYRRVRRRSK